MPSEDAAGLEVATRLAKACAWFWMLRGHLVQGRQLVDRLMVRAPGGTPAHARALLVAGGLSNYVGDGAAALRLAEEGAGGVEGARATLGILRLPSPAWGRRWASSGRS